MRVLIYLLVFGNLLVFALAGGWIGGAPSGSSGAVDALSPDRIRIVSKGDPPARPVPAVTPVMASAPVGCIEWPDIGHSQADRVVAASEGTEITSSRQVVVPETKQWWVSIPPPPNGKIGAEKKRAELRRLGIRDVLIHQEEGGDRYALSFGLYSSEAEAETVLNKLKKKSVRSARISTVVSAEARERVVLHGPGERLVTLRTTVPDHVAVNCDATVKFVAVATSQSGREEARALDGGGTDSAAPPLASGPANAPGVTKAEGAGKP